MNVFFILIIVTTKEWIFLQQLILQDLKMNNSTIVAPSDFFINTSIKRFCLALGKGSTIHILEAYFFLLISRVGKKASSCVINFPVICYVNYGSFNISFCYLHAYNLLLEYSLLLCFYLAKQMNYKWGSWKDLLPLKEYYLLSDWDIPVNVSPCHG